MPPPLGSDPHAGIYFTAASSCAHPSHQRRVVIELTTPLTSCGLWFSTLWNKFDSAMKFPSRVASDGYLHILAPHQNNCDLYHQVPTPVRRSQQARLSSQVVLASKLNRWRLASSPDTIRAVTPYQNLGDEQLAPSPLLIVGTNTDYSESITSIQYSILRGARARFKTRRWAFVCTTVFLTP